MTRAKARRRAVEAAAKAIFMRNLETARPRHIPEDRWFVATSANDPEGWQFALDDAEAALAAAERAMADAGWRMVRVPDAKDPATTPYVSNEALAQERDFSQVRRRMVADANWAAGKVQGWNACRAAMLEDGE